MIPVDRTPTQDIGLGAVLGALIGDAAGAVLEFIRRLPTDEEVEAALRMPGGGVFDVAPGQITDDGELAIALARGLSEGKGVYRPKTIATAYVDWAESGPFDMGRATSFALAHGRTSGSLSSVCREQARKYNAESKANGALMRLTPLAVASSRWTLERTVKWVTYDTEFTHPNSSCVHANVAYALAIRHMVLNRGDSSGALGAARAYLHGQCAEVEEWFSDALEQRLPDPTRMAGFVRHAFTQAFHHLHLRTSFKDALKQTLLAGGDSDTNACIVGGMMGALHGIDTLMASEHTRTMVEAVLHCDPAKGQPRPDRFRAARMIEHIQLML